MRQKIVRSPFAGKYNKHWRYDRKSIVPVATSDGINIVTGSKQ
ncbi:MAG: hypothetical protein JWN92_3135 [Candidatus Acidoferrum typicum]|nr:hypothetical protein [Candidatus Acidoferrum typicum]